MNALRELTLEGVLDHANLNVLRIALLQATGDPDLRQMRVVKAPLRGGAFFEHRLAEEHHDEFRKKSLEYLSGKLETTAPRSDRELRDLMEALTGKALTDTEFDFGREDLAFEEFPRAATWSASGRPDSASDFKVVIVGTGASGIAAAVQLERLGIPYEIVERNQEIGGTWHVNHYPDARVDTSSFLYQFKFEKNYKWPEYYASQGEVKRYIEHIAKKYGVYDNIRFGVELKRAAFDEKTDTWKLEIVSRDGVTQTHTANAVISGAGMFSTPKIPDIPGVEKFGGRWFHTTAWDDDYDVAGKRIATVGNGSTGVQLMPTLAKSAAQLYAFQRTPQWISPMEGYRDLIAPEVQWLFDNVPFYWNWFCYNQLVTASSMQDAQVYDREWQKAGGQISERNDSLRTALTEYINKKVGHDPELLAKSLPDYAPLARRLVIDNGWYDALLQDNVELVTAGIAEITETGIRTTDGRNLDVDAIVFAAGFQVTKYLWPTEYVGRGGISMEAMWDKDGPRAYLSLCVPNFPNLFVFYGPNSQQRAGSFTVAIEHWARYAAQTIAMMIEGKHRSLEVKQEVFEDYNARLDEASKALIWEKEGPAGRNYYVNEHGRQTANAPWRLDEHFAMLAEPQPDDFHIV